MTSRRPRRDDGFSLVEVLVAMGLFGVIGTLLLGLALSTTRVTEDTSSLANVTEQSRLAMERMTRELRQAQQILSVQLPAAASDPTTVTFWTDFNGNTARDVNATDPEVMTYRWDPGTRELTLTANDPDGNAISRPVLAVNVTGFLVGLHSSQWQYDKAPADGVTSWQELDQAGPPVGNKDNQANNPELEHIDLVTLALTVATDGHSQTYETQVDLRNQN